MLDWCCICAAPDTDIILLSSEKQVQAAYAHESAKGCKEGSQEF